MRPTTIHVSERLAAYAREQAEKLGLEDAEAFLTAAIAAAFHEGVLTLPHKAYDDDHFVTDPGGGVWYEGDLPADTFEDESLAELMGPPDEEEERLVRELMAQAARYRRLH